MAYKVTKAIIRRYLGCQDRDVVFGTQADAILSGVKDYRLELLRELTDLEVPEANTLSKMLVNAGLPRSVSVHEFVSTLRVLARLTGK